MQLLRGPVVPAVAQSPHRPVYLSLGRWIGPGPASTQSSAPTRPPVPHELHLRIDPETAADPALLRRAVGLELGEDPATLGQVEIRRRSIDARGRAVRIQLTVRVHGPGAFHEESIELPAYPQVSDAAEVLVVGAGPAGLFAALRLIEQGLRPVVLERGRDVRSRVQDLRAINTRHEVNPDSNYCFGEGGAGTFSDGKLFTRASKRGDVRRILRLLVGFGASRDILVDAHPHIGTNRLPPIIARMRECIRAHGGEIHFDTRVTEFLLEGDRLEGVRTRGGETFRATRTILATGHSARDIFHLLQRRGVEIERKLLAVGVRVEHPQELIDSIQYSCETRGPYLPPATYGISKQVEGRGVYSFCMCPGGVISPCATSPGEIVTNGWSSSHRSRSTANSGIVVELREEDLLPRADDGPLAAMTFQAGIERRAWTLGGRTQAAPAQRLGDFVGGHTSSTLPRSSYAPGITSADLSEVLPDFVFRSLVEGFRRFDRSLRGYLTNEAVVLAPETRTSSPVRIPRDPYTLQHVRLAGLFPCGEGAGYAGGIMSAAMDGERIADAVVRSLSVPVPHLRG